MDLSLYKDESQIEKKTPDKRKANDKSDSARKPAKDANKRKSDTAHKLESPGEDSKSNQTNVNKSASKSAKVFINVFELICCHSVKYINQSIIENATE